MTVGDDSKKDPKVWLGAGALVVVLGLGYIIATGDEASGCSVTAAGVAVIANGLATGRPTAQIVVDATAGVTAKAACQALVDRLRDDPSEPVKLEVITPAGAGEVSVTGLELTQPQPVRTTCDDWLAANYQQACFAGQIGPPVIDLNPGRPTCEDWLLTTFAQACREGRIGPPAQE